MIKTNYYLDIQKELYMIIKLIILIINIMKKYLIYIIIMIYLILN